MFRIQISSLAIERNLEGSFFQYCEMKVRPIITGVNNILLHW